MINNGAATDEAVEKKIAITKNSYMKRGGILKLTQKQRQFCEEYLIDLNATQSAIRAGYSRKTARQTAAENLSKPYIQEYIAELMRQRSERTGIKADQALQELAAIAFSDRTKIFQVTDKGTVHFTPTEELTEETRKIIANIKEGKYGVEITVGDKLKALELIGRHLGMFDEKNSGSGGNEDVYKKLDEALARIGSKL